jgi:hypothetical protein
MKYKVEEHKEQLMTATVNEILYLDGEDIYDLDDNDRICYIHFDQMKLIDVDVGDYVKITGRRSTIASCSPWSRYREPIKKIVLG